MVLASYSVQCKLRKLHLFTLIDNSAIETSLILQKMCRCLEEACLRKKAGFNGTVKKITEQSTYNYCFSNIAF